MEDALAPASASGPGATFTPDPSRAGMKEIKKESAAKIAAEAETETELQADGLGEGDGAAATAAAPVPASPSCAPIPAEAMEGEIQSQNKRRAISIDVVIMPEEFRVVEKFDSLLTLKQVRIMLCKRLSLPLSRFSLKTRNQGVECKDETYLTEWVTESEPSGSTAGSGAGEGPPVPVPPAVAPQPQTQTLELIGTVSPPKAEEEGKTQNSLSSFEVMIDTDINGHPVLVNVTVDREKDSKKAYFGGYRDKRNGKTYHHACTQTLRKPKESKTVKFTRETQTIKISNKSAQSKREQGTQMARKDLYIDSSADKIITSQPYFTTEELLELKGKKALAIQCFIRQCFAWRKVANYYYTKKDEEKRKREAEVEAERAQKEAEAERIRRRMEPTTKADFDALYEELRAWKSHQEKSIKEGGGTHDQIQAALRELLDKEVKLLQTIDKLRIKARSKVKEDQIQARLELMASPKEWLTSQGAYVDVVTPFTTRASELVQLYHGLKLRNIPDEQRIDVLMSVKYTVKEFDCPLTRDIINLCNREKDMLDRGRSSVSLAGLRRRLENLFLHFVETPEFNPSSHNFQRVPYEINSRTKIYSKSATALYSKKTP